LVALVTTLLTAVAVITLVYALQYLSLHEVVVLDALHAWQDGSKQLEVAPEAEVYVVDAAGRVLYTLGATSTCVVGETFGRCRGGPTLGAQDRRVYEREGHRWEVRRTPLSGGLTLFTQARAFTWFDEVRSFVGTLGYYLSFAILSAVPIALLLSLLMARPLVRRLHQIAGASRSFAAGDLSARTGEASDDDVGLLGRQFDAMAATISSQVRELRHLAQENHQLAVVAERHARQAERSALSRDLHDTVSQHLFSLAMGTSDLAGLIRRDPTRAAEQAEQLATIATHAQDELRGVLAQLRPSPLAGRSLLESLQELAENWSKGRRMDVTIQLTPLHLPLVVEDALYRAVQEALNNIYRHASASHVRLTLRHQAGRVVLCVADDGRGFDADTAHTGLGLLGMRERLRAVGGDVRVESSRGVGTKVCLSVPAGEDVQTD
jgi:NarL family two-component system sensor histidine kinase LiaS